VGNLLVNDSQWTSVIASGGTAGTEGMLNGTPYTYTLSLTRNASDGLDVFASITGGNINGTGSLSLAFTDATPNGGNFDFDTFALRPSSQAATANQFDTTLFQVELVPEPSTWALLGMAGFGLLLRRRRQ
jgi:PEP-CTERM motif